MAGLICAVRTAIDEVMAGAVDIHVFHPSSSGTNIVYSVKFSDKMEEGCWWRTEKPESVELWPHEILAKKEEERIKELKAYEKVDDKNKKGILGR